MEEILRRIRYNHGKFPSSEIQQMIDKKEEAIPYLLQIMHNLRDNYVKVVDRPTRIDFVYAYYLLAQFRVKDFFPIMIDILSMPDEACEHIFGDNITEGIGRVLASIYDGDVNLLYGLIENTKANEYARGQAMNALVVLVLHGRLPREEVMSYFKHLITERHVALSEYLYSEIVCCCDDLYPEEVYCDIERLYEEQVVDETVIGLADVRRTLKKTKESVLKLKQQEHLFQYITNTIKELQGWYCFHHPNKVQETMLPVYPMYQHSKIIREPARNSAIKIEKTGRNDPCTCGSGQKYKKCCGKS
ncbi:DUF1186 domain-containing protein [Paenibacillus sp. OK003]|uniref:DUF1186 domain-containing protein n=1 Tax=Paenibacillus sp. OK003 TaxID=1884380 RepID=UPI0008B49714|nr:DUF1186 domain-containing protein [Paenibacillus sp. OK003]SEL62724.1 SEC-C motif-containing protein [Paenibacillus sp. OK003]